MAGHQQITREWWENRRDRFDIYISQLVVNEAGAGDPDAARARLTAIEGLPILDLTPEAGTLAAGILLSGVLPPRGATDAGHIAIAAVHGM